MKPKHYAAFLVVLSSIFYFAMMTASQMEALKTSHARVLFLIPFVIALLAGVVALCFLFTQVFPKKVLT